MHGNASHSKEPDAPGAVPHDPPPTEDMPEEVKEPSPGAEEQGGGGGEKGEAAVQEPPD
ncbi:hypothetical protein ACFWIO_00990 [Streptomyces diastatochromogenes]|uniref:hypothetical protein n=1 Tax=Streptomyces diastatochromogenes TaxID=42236 RepID=UPI0036614643